MEFEYPDVIPIVHDDYHTQYIGRMSDGRQFILAAPFVPASDSGKGCEYIALYVFDESGKLAENEIINLGSRSDLDESEAKEKYDSLLTSLGNVKFCDIQISPFSIEKYGVEFGLIPTDPELVEDEEDMSLEFQPGNYMAFYPPWDGDYDT
jgi:hypothetical protein